jgi:hypothetical protein
MHVVLAGTQNQPIPLVDSKRAEAGAKAGAEAGAEVDGDVGADVGNRGLRVDPGYYPW